jgi:hypothetical protein
MVRLTISGFSILTAVAIGFAGDAPKDAADVPAAKRVTDQAAAVREAREVDLPLLEKADRVVIEAARTAGGGKVTLDKADDLKQLRGALKTREVPPSGGITAATVEFYHGEKLLRKVWVFEGGEWGFDRPGTSWTTGRSADLWTAVRKRLK